MSAGIVAEDCQLEFDSLAPNSQQILDKEEFTLEELLEEDDIVQECKSLNGRLVAL